MSKIKKSWDRTDKNKLHSPEGIVELKTQVRYGLIKKYVGLAESMFGYVGFDNEIFDDMRVMSQDTVPELFLMKNGSCCWFADPATEQIHCLPYASETKINMYGKISGWSPVPVGFDPLKPNESMDRIRKLKLDAGNSVIMKNDLYGGNDEGFILKMIDELTDNIVTLNQLQLLAKCPFIFKTAEDNLLSAKNFYLGLSNDAPAVFINALGEDPSPITESVRAPIDPAIFEIFDRFECMILEYIGYPCVPITKRAQQTVSEVQSNDDKIRMRRYEKWYQRESACERINAMFGTELHCISLLDPDGVPDIDNPPNPSATGEEIQNKTEKNNEEKDAEKEVI